MKGWWWRLRHRKSRSESVAFSIGLAVGRAICSMSDEDVESIKTSVKDGYS